MLSSLLGKFTLASAWNVDLAPGIFGQNLLALPAKVSAAAEAAAAAVAAVAATCICAG